jgi:signal transduction histidine kinase
MNAVYIALPFVQFALSLFLANLVVASDPSNRVNRLFTFMLLFMAAWGIAIFGMRDAFPNEPVAFSREKFALTFIPFSSVTLFHFALRYTRGHDRNRTLGVFYSLAIISGALSLTNQAVTGMEEKFYGFAPVLGWAFPVVLIAGYPPIFFAFGRLSRALKTEDNLQTRRQLKLLRFGVIALVLGATTDIIPSLGIEIYPMGIVGNLCFVGLTTWGVTRYRLMELRLVLRRGLAYSIASSFLFAVYGISFVGVFFLARSLSAPALAMTAIGAIVLVGVIVQPLMARVQQWVDRAFFRERFDRVAGLARLNELTKDITDFSAVARGITETVRKTVQADWVGIALPEEKKNAFVAVADTRETPPDIELSSRGAVISWIRRNQSAIKVSEFRSSELRESAPAEELEPLITSDAYLLVPMTVGGNLTGVMLLGGKLVGSDYNSEDRSFLGAAADQASIAVENARLYANTRRESEERAAVAELARVVGSTLEIDDVMARCAYQVKTLLKADRVEIIRLSEDETEFELAHTAGLEVDGWAVRSKGKVSEAPFRYVMERHRGAVLDLQDPDIAGSSKARDAVAAGLISMISIPLISKEKLIGALNIQSIDPEAYGAEELELATRIAAQVTNAIANSLLYEQALQLAEEREARARLDAENRELQRINEAKIAFLSTVSHELRTPLTSMMAFTDILKRNKQQNLSEKEISHLEVIRRNGRRLGLLIGDLLDVSRIDAGALKLEMSEFEARELVRELYESFQPLLDRKQQSMALILPDEDVTAFADRDRIAQVVSNLMSNASKYSGESTQTTVKMEADEDMVRISVTDQGIGISEEDQKQLFTSFFRADNEATRSEPGTGLGLVIVKGIIEMHRGQIRIESEIGKGTTVHISFARRAEAQAEVQSAA